ncbi:MAG: PAS domain S-box protein [Chloroflexi bacterium]|nr:PAS domain S-box protein [Chloroflexota bacterium]
MSQVPDIRITSEEEYRNIFETASDGVLITDLETGSVLDANPAAAELYGYSREEFIGLLPAAFIHPDGQNVFRNYLQAFRSGVVFDPRVLHVRRDGSTFNAELRGTAFTYQGRPCLLGVVRDVSRRIQADQRLHQRVKTHTREQATLLEISHTLASTLELQPGLILDQLQGVIEYTRAGFFGLTDSTLTALAMRGCPGFSGVVPVPGRGTGSGPQELEQAAPFQVRLEGPETLATLFNGHRPIRIADVWSADPAAEFLRSLLDQQVAVLLEGVQAWMWVPLAVKGRIIGGLGIAHARRNYFTAHHADLALSVANQAAITMINAELYGHAQALAVLEERQRLARNLHDAVNQSLFSAGLIAEVLPRLWDRDQEQARQSLEDLRRLTRGAMAEMRALLAELRPSTLTDADLGDLLRLLGNAFTGRTNIPAKVTVVGEGILPAEVQVAIYRVCQEALNNVVKHAGASMVEMYLKHEDTGIELSIRDDGQGFDPEETTSGHYGLSMMHERAKALGAILSITSQPGHGTELTFRWTEAEKKEAL